MRTSFIILVTALLAAVSVDAIDRRLDYKLAKGQTVDQFCTKWTADCTSYVNKHNPGAGVGFVCEPGPFKNEAQAYCTATVVKDYTTRLAKEIGATPY
ncbi:hypothetical protein INT44_001680 [Umbelopsis vinacea]|uniref:Uncharacterized protein n=1 Tax=Umbelopsis vinacea TaxID=44442 RepID=A0A8H7PRF1_9FUNG|nr:hypothetical protein INT44_001680 [Umbelopsis vinacea]KAI9283577.1 hypothetical protein BC943DRAFT_362156 [Umbelopsis sp. AD052]